MALLVVLVDSVQAKLTLDFDIQRVSLILTLVTGAVWEVRIRLDPPRRVHALVRGQRARRQVLAAHADPRGPVVTRE